MINPEFNLGLLAGHNIWQSIIIFTVVFIILKAIKQTSAEERSWSWSATLFALALLPMAAFLPGEGIKWQSETPLIEFEMVEPLAAEPVIKNKNKSKTATVIFEKKSFIEKEVIISALMGLWFIGMIIALARLAIAAFNASNLRKSAYPYAPEDQNFDKCWPADVEIAVSDEINGPIVIGILKPTVLIPRSFAYEMKSQELNPLLFHELAHVKRNDNILHLFERLILSVYWWNPVMHFIAGRISEERELACDDRAAKSCGDHIIYAKSLLKGARQLMGQNKSILGLAVLRRESPLSKRVKRLTTSPAFAGLNLLRLGRNLTLLFSSILLLGLITPRIAVGQVDIDRSGLSSVETQLGALFLEATWQGKIELNAQETDIVGLGEDGYFSLETEQDGLSRKLIITRGDGELLRTYMENGQNSEMDQSDLSWQADNLKSMLRLSGINAEKRVDDLYAAGGADAVLDEMDKLLSDYAVRLYAQSLVDVYELDQKQISRLITTVDKMDSDYEKGITLTAIADEQDLDGDTVKQLTDVATKTEGMDIRNEDVVLAMADIETASGFESFEIELQEEMENIPSEEELERIREEVERELENIPTAEELEIIFEKAQAEMPTEQELERIFEEAQAEIPTEEELRIIIEEARAEIPTEEELRIIIEEARAEIPTEEELRIIIEEAKADLPDEEEIRIIIEEARAEMPTKEEIARIVEEARAEMPTKEEIARIVEEARAEMPTKEEIARMVEEAKAAMPSAEELEQFKLEMEQLKLEMKENMKDMEIMSEKERQEMKQSIQESLENARLRREKRLQENQN